MSLRERVLSTMKSRDIEGNFELYVTRTPGYLWALFFRWLHVHPIIVTLLSIVIGCGSAYFFASTDLRYNLIGMLMLVWANWYDCADGQLARMTGQKTLVGRVLDGFGGELWFICIYIGIAVRLYPDWGFWIFLVILWAGFYCHARQCGIADYYRNAHLWATLGKEGSEFDVSIGLQQRMDGLKWNKKEWFEKFYLFFYIRYIRTQERQTPEFQLLRPLMEELPLDAPARQQFRQESLPLMPLCNILTFDTRVIVLFISMLIGYPWVYFLFEMTFLEALRLYTTHRHEAFCHRLHQKLCAI
ncbi:MAG: CDP-alcohol phosphatidyltransferase family protein [Bacteroidaceae bacterium]|nr:CDP-alcohol phosphatidyltransferase family protein [Bacteroidaceae bacterium]MBQ9171019.1 CDP-alcohol phosphatidyltransferase family protein [Bacteroidaceae bacterium]MBQ9295557.1 CDP-alcohol phosphatidyltransferase family protein [Bacteroidaceae bacterium]